MKMTTFLGRNSFSVDTSRSSIITKEQTRMNRIWRHLKYIQVFSVLAVLLIKTLLLRTANFRHSEDIEDNGTHAARRLVFPQVWKSSTGHHWTWPMLGLSHLRVSLKEIFPSCPWLIFNFEPKAMKTFEKCIYYSGSSAKTSTWLQRNNVPLNYTLKQVYENRW